MAAAPPWARHRRRLGTADDVDAANPVQCDPLEPLPVMLTKTPTGGMNATEYTCQGSIEYYVDEFAPLHFIIGFIAMASCVTNTVAVVGIAGSGKDVVQFQTLWLICFQAVTDFAFSWLTAPFYMVTYLSQRWVGGQGTCNVVGFLVHFFGLATILSLCVLTYARYRAIILPMKRMKRGAGAGVAVALSRRELAIAYSVVWGTALCYGLAPFATPARQSVFRRALFHTLGAARTMTLSSAPLQLELPRGRAQGIIKAHTPC